MPRRSQVQALGLTFPNPILVASTDIARSPQQFEAFAKSGVGGIICKSVTDAAALQNDSIARIHITDMHQRPVAGSYPDSYYFFSRGGSMLSMAAFEEKAPELLALAAKYGTVAIGSISASRLENWVAYARRMEELGFAALELNFGNPHGEAADGKLGFLIGQSPELCVQIARAVMDAVHIPVIAKLTPQISDLVALTKALENAGVQAVTVMHRFQGLMIDPDTDEPILGGWAAIGGPWMKPISLANVAKVRRATGLTVLGGNGADTARDVYDFLLSGASLVEIGSSMMLRGPEYARQLVAALEQLLKEKNTTAADALGRAAQHIVTYKNLGTLPPRSSQLEEDLCRTCTEKPCLQTCYFGALHSQDGTVRHDSDSCSGCGLCTHTCPKNAVTMKLGG